MKNIIIAGPPRAGKSTLAKRINDELGFFAIALDKLVATLEGAYPQLDIKLNWDREQTASNLAPFLGHFLGMFSSADGRGLLPYNFQVDDLQSSVEEAIRLGATKAAEQYGGEHFVTLIDPEGHPFCLCGRGNA